MSRRRPSERTKRASSAGGAPGGFQLGPGVWTRLRYRVFDGEGEPLSAAPAETGVVFGYGALLPALERALEGKGTGERLSLELEPAEAYGERDPALYREVDRSEFPPDVTSGDHFDAERDDGVPVVLRVLEVTDGGVVMDLNHPLAGQRIRYEIEVLEARPASTEELLLAEEEAGEVPDGGPEPGLITPGSLLQRGSRR